MGYDFVEGADIPTWRIWFEGEAIIVTANDPAAGTLISAFQLEAAERATAKANRDSARTTLLVSGATFLFGFLSAGGGIAVAIPSCATVPLTLWAAGGTGWICAGGVAAAVGGIGALVVSGIVGVLSIFDRARADAEFQAADDEAKDLFQALKGYAAP